jgi:hypothetical protein
MLWSDRPQRKLMSGTRYVSPLTPVARVMVLTVPCFQVLLIDPGQLKIINDLLQKESRGRGRTETLAMSTTA